MKIEVRQLMDENEMLCHIFFGCIPYDKLEQIKEKYVGEADWQKESVKIPVEMKIGGVSVNPKKFFDAWKEQMHRIISEEANKLVAEKVGSKKVQELANKMYEIENVLKHWEGEINWEAKNPLL